jgi:oxepin-CoA hydrolase / 3-oxo-5,6-dehydrosuberyl-CoA semialdehyde dehydrogenase
MITIPFTVNDDKLRKTFFNQLFIECIDNLAEDARPLWGKMSPHNMVEHLLWTFECSTGRLVVTCRTPEHILERVKKLLYDDRPMPREFKNPLLDETPPPHRFQAFSEAKIALREEVAHYVRYYSEHPEAIHTHPIFGPLGKEEWERAQFKHCYHHLLQFAVVIQAG